MMQRFELSEQTVFVKSTHGGFTLATRDPLDDSLLQVFLTTDEVRKLRDALNALDLDAA